MVFICILSTLGIRYYQVFLGAIVSLNMRTFLSTTVTPQGVLSFSPHSPVFNFIGENSNIGFSLIADSFGAMFCRLGRLPADHTVGSEFCKFPGTPREQSSVHSDSPPLLIVTYGLLHWSLLACTTISRWLTSKCSWRGFQATRYARRAYTIPKLWNLFRLPPTTYITARLQNVPWQCLLRNAPLSASNIPYPSSSSVFPAWRRNLDVTQHENKIEPPRLTNSSTLDCWTFLLSCEIRPVLGPFSSHFLNWKQT